MQATMLYGPRDIRFEKRPVPTILKPTDAIVRIAATCVCGSDLWPYRGIQTTSAPTPMGHEYCGVVEEVGSAVHNVMPAGRICRWRAGAAAACTAGRRYAGCHAADAFTRDAA